ncbi:MAG: hypothetical protein ACODAJ_12395 [Planctomycetota bacterium]
MDRINRVLVVLALLCCWRTVAMADDPWVVFEGKDGPGEGKHIVLIAGDDEYRSEELIPQLAKILAVHHGFKCTVLFATDPKTGEIDPATQTTSRASGPSAARTSWSCSSASATCPRSR